MTQTFFISYAHDLADDRNLAHFLWSGLSAAGHEVFIDTKIQLGEEWSKEISRHIAYCDYVIVLLSSESVNSEMVLGEVRQSHERYKKEGAPRLLPIRVRYDGSLGYELGSYLLPLQHKHWLEMVDSQLLLNEILAIDKQSLLTAPTTLGRGDSWNEVLERSRKQTERFLREAQGSKTNPGRFIPDIYVHRQAADNVLHAFLGSDTLGLFLIGDYGVGKTNLLCQWALDLLQEGHGVFVYICGGSLGPEVDHELMQDLSPYVSDTLPAILKRVDDLAARERRKFVIMFDALNEFRGNPGTGPEYLLKRIDALIERLPGRNVRVIINCSAATWYRLQRIGEIQLYRDRYYPSSDDEPSVRLGAFTAEEFEAAYPKYQAYFQLGLALDALSPQLRDWLSHPLQLRLLADIYGGRDDPITTRIPIFRVYQRYYDDRVKHPRDRVFIDSLAAEMLRQQRAALPVTDLVYHSTLGPEILRDPTDSSYYRLLDNGILTETASDWGMGGSTVKFTYPLIGAYAVASHLQRQPTTDIENLATLIAQVSHFAFAWDVARALLLLRPDFSLFAEVADSSNSGLRELGVECLVALNADDQNKARQYLRKLLESDSEEARRTALKAAYQIGAGTRDLFLWVAESKSPAVRQAAQDTLYLIWQRDPDFTYGLLHELLGRISLDNLFNIRKILEFIINLSITIYINHCDRQDVVDRTVKLYYELATERLLLQLFRTDIFGPRFERLVFRSFASAFAKPVLKAMLEVNPGLAINFFDLPFADRACLKRIAPVLDPQADLESVSDDLIGMLQSDVKFFNIFAAVPIEKSVFLSFHTLTVIWC